MVKDKALYQKEGSMEISSCGVRIPGRVSYHVFYIMYNAIDPMKIPLNFLLPASEAVFVHRTISYFLNGLKII